MRLIVVIGPENRAARRRSRDIEAVSNQPLAKNLQARPAGAAINRLGTMLDLPIVAIDLEKPVAAAEKLVVDPPKHFAGRAFLGVDLPRFVGNRANLFVAGAKLFAG